MNDIQIQTILTKIAEFNQVRLEDLIAQAYEGVQDLSQQSVDRYKIPEYVSLANRVLKQLNAELLGGLGPLLPMIANPNDDFGALNLQNDLTNFLNLVKSKQFQASEAHLLKLAHYELIHGFFDKSVFKIHDLRGLRITELENRLSVIGAQLTRNIELRNQLFAELEKKKAELTDFEAAKRRQLEQIAQNLQAANQQTNQISELLNKSNSSNARIDTMLEQQGKNLVQAAQAIQDASMALKQLSSDKEQLLDDGKGEVTELQDKNLEFQKILEHFEGKKAFFDERIAYLDELIGREVGASLFGTFKQRKTELQSPLTFWKWGVLAMSIITVLGITAIFTNIFGLFGEATADFTWQRLVLNSLKTLPFFILLFFAIRQYARERIFQEEYAFKSAVALTIDAYSKLISKQESKDDLIFKAVEGIYRSPISVKDKSDSEEKDLLETLKNASEAVKNVTKGK
jgi:hypothetical protein